jgi:hypothetical protein
MQPKQITIDKLRNGQAFIHNIGGNVWIKLLGQACINIINGEVQSVTPNTLVYPVWITNIEYKHDQ